MYKIELADFVLQKTLSTQGAAQLMWTRLRRLLVRTFNDPSCSFTAHGRTLRLPLSHELPTYLRLLPLYDRLPERLGAYLHNQYGPLKVLDVGANIGDSVAALYRDERDLFLAVEPDPKFNRCLHENWKVPNVRILDLVCSSRSGKEGYEMIEKFGTASFRLNPRGLEFRAITVDDLLAENPEFTRPHLIKVDTDGNDFAVLAGAQQALTGQPAVLFECDVFGNVHYLEDCLETLTRFSAAGYRSMLVYEKFGYPLGCYELNDLTHFRELLFYQLTKKFIYFDILLMKAEDLLPFSTLERSFLLGALQDQSLRSTAAMT
jgi:FkbM family methyltransferase